jgi:hypothetical protein
MGASSERVWHTVRHLSAPPDLMKTPLRKKDTRKAWLESFWHSNDSTNSGGSSESWASEANEREERETV